MLKYTFENPMAENYDIVSIGSGHNGLVAAAYMATAGKKVLVLERNDWFGGGVVLRRNLPDPGIFMTAFSTVSSAHPGRCSDQDDQLKLALALSAQSFLTPTFPFCACLRTGPLSACIEIGTNYQEIAKFSKKTRTLSSNLPIPRCATFP